MGRFTTVPNFWNSVSCPDWSVFFEPLCFIISPFLFGVYEWLLGCNQIRMKSENTQGAPPYTRFSKRPKGTGPESAGQSGDIQGLPEDPQADSERVEELVEEGQYFEAEIVNAV